MTERQDEQLNEDVTALVDEPLNVDIETVAEEDAGGVIQISKLALLSVIKKYVLSVDGVIRFQNQSLMDGMLDILSSKHSERSISIETPETGAVITVTVVIRFGMRIPDVAHEIQRVLRERVEELTGYTVAKVNVNVSDLEEVRPVESKATKEVASAEATEQSAEEETIQATSDSSGDMPADTSDNKD